MRVILDTSVWVEYLKANEPIKTQVLTLLNNDDVIGVSTVFGELFYGVRDKREKETLKNLWELLPKINEHELLISAGLLASEMKLIHQGVGLIDTSLMYLAKQNHLPLWTLDKRLLRNTPDQLVFNP